MQVQGKGLTGLGAAITATEVTAGYMQLSSPIGTMLQSHSGSGGTPPKTGTIAPVSVVVNGIGSRCGSGASRYQRMSAGLNADEACTFAFSPAATPVMVGTTPAHGTTGTDVQLRFSLPQWQNASTSVDATVVDVAVGRTACTVLAGTIKWGAPTSLSCTLQYCTGGNWPIHLRIPRFGYSSLVDANNSNRTWTFQCDVRVDSIVPAAGSRAGGTVVTVYGSGFSTILAENTVMLGGAPNVPSPCTVLRVEAMGTRLVCRTTAAAPSVALLSSDGGGAGVVDVEVTVAPIENVEGRAVSPVTTTKKNAFDYSWYRTPTVIHMTPVVGSAGGGTTIVFNGSGFGSGVGNNTIMIGTRLCPLVRPTERNGYMD